ncbi:hypothetical protein BpHYR1_034383 [Brachionus plicatilis]|uniref:Uncharacterized protein n=1 Tax=Brachionus plicatilis TaxID=10195 RepID=A0A3M7SVV8_BRAPC|nr:hypothetical protein BpHYR1_034383 [Brachionus plicatilis]
MNIIILIIINYSKQACGDDLLQEPSMSGDGAAVSAIIMEARPIYVYIKKVVYKDIIIYILSKLNLLKQNNIILYLTNGYRLFYDHLA